MKQKIIFCNAVISIVIIWFFSCRSIKVVPEKPQYSKEDTVINIVLTIKRKVPYCGGAYPSPEQANKTVIEKNSDFIIQYQRGYGDSLWYKECETDTSGMIHLYLPDGKYCLKRADKKKSFDDFYKFHKKEDDAYNLYRDSTCYYNWWKSCSLEFELSAEAKTVEIEVVIPSRCYTGEDPCHNYIGPYPP